MSSSAEAPRASRRAPRSTTMKASGGRLSTKADVSQSSAPPISMRPPVRTWPRRRPAASTIDTESALASSTAPTSIRQVRSLRWPAYSAVSGRTSSMLMRPPRACSVPSTSMLPAPSRVIAWPGSTATRASRPTRRSPPTLLRSERRVMLAPLRCRMRPLCGSAAYNGADHGCSAEARSRAVRASSARRRPGMRATSWVPSATSRPWCALMSYCAKPLPNNAVSSCTTVTSCSAAPTTALPPVPNANVPPPSPRPLK
ncbi:hypothetical protein D3C71_631060 [compost metagenome]